MVLGSLRKGISLDGYLRAGLLFPAALEERHHELVVEMEVRNYSHNTPLHLTSEVARLIAPYYYDIELYGSIMIASIHELFKRCDQCRINIERWAT